MGMFDEIRDMYNEQRRGREEYGVQRVRDNDLHGKRDSLLSRLPKKAMTIGLAATLGLFTYGSFRHGVGETEVGAKINKVTGSCEELTAGTHFFAPIINDWYKLDARQESTTMTEGQEGDRKFDDRLPFKTRDGNEIRLNLTVPYNVQATKACYIIMNVARSNEELKEKIARPYTRSIPRDHFGALSSEEFANTKDRNAMARNAAKDLGAVLDRFGLLSTTVNTGKYDFANVEYRKLVQEMKVAETEFPAVVASLAAQTEENNRLLNEAEKYKKETVANSDGALNQAKVAADGYLGSKRAEAAGIMARGRNRAEAIRKERESMISSGGQTKIQMQIAQCLRGKPIVPVPICDKNGMQLQTFDLNNFLSTYAVTKAKAAEEK